MDLFRIHSPSAQLAAEMRRRIQLGQWERRLPGVFRLMAEFQVTRATVEQALAELLHTGDLKARGRRRAPVPVHRIDRAEAQGTLLVFERMIELHTPVREALLKALPEPVVPLVVEDPDQRPDVVAGRILRTGWRNMVLVGHSGNVADLLTQAERNVVGCGGPGRPTRASSVYVSLELLVREGFRKAFEAGHQSVCYPLWRCRPEYVDRIYQWGAEEFARAGRRYSTDFNVPLIEDRAPSALHECLRALMRHTPPTALLSETPEQSRATMAVMAEQGKRIPRDVSHITLSFDPQWEVLPLSQAHFAFPTAKIVSTIKSMLKAAKLGRAPRCVMLPPTWVPGASLARWPTANLV